MKTLAFLKCSADERPYVVLLHTAEAPDEAEWQAYVAALRALLSASARKVQVFVATDGGGPNAGQRKDLAAVIARGPGDAVTHVFTTSAFVRGVVTAFRWIARARAVAHLPAEFQDVCERGGLSPVDVLRSFAEVQKMLPRVLALGRILDDAALLSGPAVS